VPEAPRPTVTLYTDGACSGNPGPGGWAALLESGPHERELSGGEPNTTNNRMELRAVIEGLDALRTASRVMVHTDSAYIANAFNQNWIKGWQRNGWKTASRQPVKNQDLWQRLLQLMERHDVEFVKVKGHADDERNNRVDRLAVAEVDRIRQRGSRAR
jgi:ribonuclease HI